MRSPVLSVRPRAPSLFRRSVFGRPLQLLRALGAARRARDEARRRRLVEEAERWFREHGERPLDQRFERPQVPLRSWH